MNRLLKNISLVCLGMALVIGALSSCGDKELEEGRNDVENNNSEESGDSEGELVEVHFTARQPGSDDSETRSSFVPGSTRLVWSDYDNLGVYAYETGVASPASSTVATIDGNSVGSTSATFTGSMTLTKDKYYRYYAYYPETESTVNAVNGKTVTFTIPRNQSEEFGKYQICYAKSTQHQSVGGTPPTIKFDGFAPATALVRVYPVLDPNLPDETLELTQLVLGSRNKKLAGGTDFNFNMETGAWKTGTEAVVNSIKTVEVTKSKGGYFDFVIIPGATGSLSVIDPAHYLAGSIEIDSEIVPGTFYEKTVTLSEARLLVDKNNAPTSYGSVAVPGNSNPTYREYNDPVSGKKLALLHTNFKIEADKTLYMGATGYLKADCFKELRTIVVCTQSTDFKLYYTGSEEAATYATFGTRRCYFPPVGCTGFKIKNAGSNTASICESIHFWYEGEPTTEILKLDFIRISETDTGTDITSVQPFTKRIPTHNDTHGNSPLPTALSGYLPGDAPENDEVIERTNGVTYKYKLEVNDKEYDFNLHAQYSAGKGYNQKDAYCLYLNSKHGLLMGDVSGAYIQFPGITDKKLVYVDYFAVDDTDETKEYGEGIGAEVNKSSTVSVDGGGRKPFRKDNFLFKYHLSGTFDGARYRLQSNGNKEYRMRVASLTLIYE